MIASCVGMGADGLAREEQRGWVGGELRWVEGAEWGGGEGVVQGRWLGAAAEAERRAATHTPGRRRPHPPDADTEVEGGRGGAAVSHQKRGKEGGEEGGAPSTRYRQSGCSSISPHPPSTQQAPPHHGAAPRRPQSATPGIRKAGGRGGGSGASPPRLPSQRGFATPPWDSASLTPSPCRPPLLSPSPCRLPLLSPPPSLCPPFPRPPPPHLPSLAAVATKRPLPPHASQMQAEQPPRTAHK